jgi:thiol:disulfide interchange protein DsbD
VNGRPLLLVLLALAACLWAAAAPAADMGAGHATARLVAGVDGARPGSGPLLGVRFDIEPGWHIYWKHPGGAGLATEVRWLLPQGLEAGPLQWPLPIAFAQAEGIPGYGYEGSVVLAAELRGAAAPARVGAEISWLACNEVCVLGRTELAGELGALPTDPAFADWSSGLAEPLDASAPFTVTTTGGTAQGTLGLWLRWRGESLAVEWFPDPPRGLVVGEATVRARGNLTRIDAPVRWQAGAAKERSLRSLIVTTDARGARRGWELATELEP